MSYRHNRRAKWKYYHQIRLESPLKDTVAESVAVLYLEKMMDLVNQSLNVYLVLDP